MAVIAFSDKPGHSWVVAGWAYRQVLEDVMSHYPEEDDIVHVLAEKKAGDGLLAGFLEPPLTVRITSAIRRVAEGILWSYPVRHPRQAL
jgi:hypothetical protein